MSIYGKKPLQYCKVISLQLIKVKEKKKKKYYIRIPKQDSANILQIRKSYTNINFIQKQPNDTEKHGVWGLKIYFLFCDFCPPHPPLLSFLSSYLTFQPFTILSKDKEFIKMQFTSSQKHGRDCVYGIQTMPHSSSSIILDFSHLPIIKPIKKLTYLF